MTRAFVALALLTTPALGETSFQTASYMCDRGVVVPVTYVDGDDRSIVVFTVEGSQITLLNEQAGSGARYAWPSDGANYVWWSKGEEATLYWKEAGQETALLTCKEQM